MPAPYHLRSREQRRGHHRRHRRARQGRRQVGGGHRLEQPGHGRSLDQWSVRQHPARHRPGQAPPPAPGLDPQLLGRQADRTGRGLSRPARQRRPLLSPCRAQPARHSRPRRDLRHQPGRRRLSRHQPDRALRPQGLQHRRGRRRHRRRHEPQGRLRQGRGRADHRRAEGPERQTARTRRDSPRWHRLLPLCLRRGDRGPRRHPRLHGAHARLRPRVLPRRRARRTPLPGR